MGLRQMWNDLELDMGDKSAWKQGRPTTHMLLKLKAPARMLPANVGGCGLIAWSRVFAKGDEEARAAENLRNIMLSLLHRLRFRLQVLSSTLPGPRWNKFLWDFFLWVLFPSPINVFMHFRITQHMALSPLLIS